MGRIRKGFSGNPKGRPPKPERSFTEKQAAQDALTELNREIVSNGERLPAIVAIWRKLVDQAVKGDLPSMRVALHFYVSAAGNLEGAAPEIFEQLRFTEKFIATDPAARKDRKVARMLNEQRKQTREL